MTTNNEKAPATAPTVNEGMELGKRSAQQSTATQDDPKVVYHLIINLKEVKAGRDKVTRALCGTTIAQHDSTRARSRTAVQSSPKSVLCPDCEALRELEAGLGL